MFKQAYPNYSVEFNMWSQKYELWSHTEEGSECLSKDVSKIKETWKPSDVWEDNPRRTEDEERRT